MIDAENGASCPNNHQLVTWNQQGPQGPQGPAGTPGASGYEWKFEYGTFSSESTKSHVLSCPAGKRALGGGGLVFGANGARVPGVVLDGSFPWLGTSEGWQVRAHEAVPTDAGWRIAVHVICASVS